MRKLGHFAAMAYGAFVLGIASLLIGLAAFTLIRLGWHQNHIGTVTLLGVVALIALVVAVTRD